MSPHLPLAVALPDQVPIGPSLTIGYLAKSIRQTTFQDTILFKS